MIKKYVIGIVRTKDSIVLIKKNKPDWQKDKYNFVGGKIEENETPSFAIIREFEEETGIKTVFSDWSYKGIIFNEGDDGWVVYVYSSFDEKYKECKTITDEEILHLPLDEFRQGKFDNMCLDNIKVLFEMAHFSSAGKISLEYF